MTADAQQPLSVAVTLDVDPDANRAAPGRTEAVGAYGGAPAVVACAEGLGRLADLLDEFALPATVFWAGRTLEALADDRPELVSRFRGGSRYGHACHGYAHEDFAGAVSGRALDAGETDGVLRRARDACMDVLGCRPLGFRAPYCRMTAELETCLPALGFRYDASKTVSVRLASDLRPRPVRPDLDIFELPLCRSTDPAGRPVTGYLWQLFEGRRPFTDYVGLIGAVRELCGGGLLQLAIHPWHLVMSANGDPFPADHVRRSEAGLRRLLRAVADDGGIVATTDADYLKAGPDPSEL